MASYSFLSLLFLLTFFTLISCDDNPFTHLDCPTDSNFTANSSYESNLHHLLSTLPSSTSLTGFSFSSKGSAYNEVFTRVLCRGDLSPSICQSCVTTAVEGIKSRCPFGKRAIIFYDKCILRYSDTNTTSQQEKSSQYILYNVNDVSDIQTFEDLYTELMGNIISAAANSSRMSNFGQANYTNDITMYGLVECIRDITREECYTCLKESIGEFQKCCSGKQGGVVLRYECYLRSEIYPYYYSTVMLAPPPPSPVLQSPPAPSIVSSFPEAVNSIYYADDSIFYIDPCLFSHCWNKGGVVDRYVPFGREEKVLALLQLSRVEEKGICCRKLLNPEVMQDSI